MIFLFRFVFQEFIKIGALGKETWVPSHNKHDLIIKLVSSQKNSLNEQIISDYVNRQISSNAQIVAGIIRKRPKEDVNSNFILLQYDYPEMYVNRLADLVYPDIFVTSFSAESDNSVMWGNYADSHKGVCLEYETLGNDSFKLSSIPIESNEDGTEKTNADIPISKVNYAREGEGVVSRNFFESMGRLTLKNVNQWLTGKDGKRSKIFNLQNYDTWRAQYWQDLKGVYNRKMDTWSYEQEYRIIRDSIYAGFNEKAQTYKYDPSQLNSVIFGIKTSITDRAAIMDAVKKAYGSLDKVQWKQAEYDKMSQKISVIPITIGIS